ncbi:MAG: tetratricopeptide repeat protein [Spirochaetia bacterium]|nr:tetratricopeptide repeat protein [Spirochaetia bacterium]
MTMNEKAKKYFIAGMKYHKNKDFEGAKAYFTKAIDCYSEVIKSGRGDISVYDNRGVAYMCTKKHIEAKEDFTKAIELGANDKDIYRNRGIAYTSMGNYANALEDFAKAIELGANDEATYENRGFAYLHLEYYTEAVEDFTKAIQLGANNKLIYVGRGSAYIGIKNYPKVIDDFTKAIKSGINSKVIYVGRGVAYIATKDYQKAKDDFTQVVKLHKNGKGESKHTTDNDYTLNKIKLTDNILDLVIDILHSNESNVLSDDETLNLIELVYYCYDLMNEIKIEPSEVKGEQFVHYTKAGTLQYLLKKDHSAKLRLNNAVYMNDPEEGQILKKVLCQLDQNNELENLLKDTENIKNYTYLTCFSPYDKRDELPMWIHYGDGGKGVGLVFHNSFFKGTDLYKVQYIDVKNFDIRKLDRKVRKKIRIILNLLRKDEVKNNTNKEFKDYVNIILNYVSYLFKDKAYEYENEVRILNYKDYDSQDIKTDDVGRDIPRLFIEYKQCITDKNCVEVIAGPKAQYTEIAAYAKYVGIPKVSQSEIKYR